MRDAAQKGLNCLSALMLVDTVPYYRPAAQGGKWAFLTADGLALQMQETTGSFFSNFEAFLQVIV